MKVIVGIVENDNRFLLIKRVIQEGRLSWAFPAGKMENYDKDEAECVEREIFEETGIQCLAQMKIGERNHPDTHVDVSYWLCKNPSGLIHISEPWEVSEVIWADAKEVFRLITSDIFPPLEDYIKSKSVL